MGDQQESGLLQRRKDLKVVFHTKMSLFIAHFQLGIKLCNDRGIPPSRTPQIQSKLAKASSP